LTIAQRYLVTTHHRAYTLGHDTFVAAPPAIPRRHAGPPSSIMEAVPTPPQSTKNSLRYRLITRTRERWPQLADLTIAEGILDDPSPSRSIKRDAPEELTTAATVYVVPKSIARVQPPRRAQRVNRRPA